MSNGSSPTFIIYGSVSFGADGATGPTGPTGPTGSTGDCLQGNTGYGITGIGIRGDDLGITFGSGNTLTLILNASIKGPTGTTRGNATSFNIRGTTTEGVYVIITQNVEEFAANSVTYDIESNGSAESVQLRGLTFRNITISDSVAGITLTGITSNFNFQGSTGDLVYVAGTSGTIFLKGASGNSWDTLYKNITLRSVTSKEKDVSGITQQTNNYRTTNIDPTIDEETIDMPITGYTFNCINALPISSIDGITTQQGLYIQQPAGEEIDIQRLYFLGQQAITASNHTTFTPQNIGITYGSCVTGSNCIDYSTQASCDAIGGNFGITSCAVIASSSLKACCLYDYSIGGVTCINILETECKRFMGVVGNYTCDVYDGILELCPDDLCFSCNIGKCCFKGKCYSATELECFTNYPGSIWFNEGCT